VIAAISVSAPAYRFPMQRVEEVSKLVRDVTHTISARLGNSLQGR
jgi:DNA-binding IclR family transcriptional regulator